MSDLTLAQAADLLKKLDESVAIRVVNEISAALATLVEMQEASKPIDIAGALEQAFARLKFPAPQVSVSVPKLDQPVIHVHVDVAPAPRQAMRLVPKRTGYASLPDYYDLIPVDGGAR